MTDDLHETGVYGGRTIHWEDPASWTGRHYLTLCGQVSSRDSRPGSLKNRNPPACRACTRVKTERP